MKCDMALFKPNETKSTTLTLRLTPSQKDVIYTLAKQRGETAARFILGLVGKECGYICNTHEITQANNKTKPYIPDCEFDEINMIPCTNNNKTNNDDVCWLAH